MQNKKFNKIAVSAAALVLSLVLIASCGSAGKSGSKSANQNVEQSDSTFVPTHPPVVVPHTWRDSK